MAIDRPAEIRQEGHSRESIHFRRTNSPGQCEQHSLVRASFFALYCWAEEPARWVFCLIAVLCTLMDLADGNSRRG
jgi:hypothetical protein